MEYNTTRGPLILPEYGRNVQKMIAYAMEITDRTERNRAAQAIIEVMGQLNPHLRDVDDFRHKLWTHLFVMSDFKLDVDSPYEIPKQEVLNERPQIMEYPSSKIRFGHYGKYTQKILETAGEITDEKEKEYMKNTMANFMKKQFLAYNNDAVENNVIAEQLKELSKGELILENPDELVNTNTILRSMGLNQNKWTNKPKKNQKQNQKKKFIKKP
ncbi:MAG: DUF4290 domain-containing protein [Crocinitomicaceae bacterium]|jgi:hypothetical protein|nr:DUF4290 domain-containing protein [Crocinitomicaceae bacterium]MDP4684315.1 DUF4290 domain-containing protein [Crocinitomicaceae bacterium]MDP4866609.1 DUF4290 domain-containing protein [Crocinitomicaceae bacterium]MDP5011462.1 DUF4290 domain-containing protein [Crocinitomicaceae bacterium]